MRLVNLSLFIGTLFYSVSWAQFAAADMRASQQIIEETTIIGDRSAARALLGSGALVDAEQLRAEVVTDVNQALKTVPGIYILEEDGQGLRPNIGIRAATSPRSAKITLLEDGVMISPAPYSNPAAYYFPTALRMHALEVIKGAPLLRYGPQTTGGVLNIVSTPIPEARSGVVQWSAGQYGQMDLLANYGGRSGAYGFLIETAQRSGDGFKSIDSGGDTGYRIQDYLAKLTREDADSLLSLKVQVSKEISDETYLGLSDSDFDSKPNRRYGLSRPDVMDNHHKGFLLRYQRLLSEDINVTLTAYRNEFERDWFKLSGGGSLIAAANAGNAEARGILHGLVDRDGLTYKHNNRAYLSSGVEANFDWDLGSHQIDVGIRSHTDEMDRFQPQEVFNQVAGQLVYQKTKAPTGSNNRLERARAKSFWLLDSWQVNQALTVHGALRYEDVNSRRRQFADTDRDQLASERNNATNVWLPGLSFGYQLSDSLTLIGSAHRGFSPLGGSAKKAEKPETSINYETGLRYSNGYFAEAIWFYSDFENKSENCSNASPCSNGETSGSFTTGAAVIEGLELQVGHVFRTSDKVSIPVDASYTRTKARISKNNPTSGFNRGDSLAAVPENVFSLRAALQYGDTWRHGVVVKYIDEMCIAVGCNRSGGGFKATESLISADYVGRYQWRPKTELFFKLENVFDRQVIISRTPDGARPNKRRTASIGFSLQI